jgi:hypothetical protein
MQNPSIKLGDGNWSAKDSKLLGFRPIVNKVAPIEFDVSRASTATRVNREGLIESVANNIARVDFADDVNGALLLEPQSTNLVTYSQDFSNAGWVKANVTITSNYGISVDGSQNSTKLVFASGVSYLTKTSGTGNGQKASSIYVKGIIGEILKFGKGVNVGTGTNFTLNGEWQRLEEISTNSGTAFHLTSNIGGANATEVEVFGAQLEESSVATSYIATSGTTVTRLADAVGGAGDASTFNSTEGVLYAEIKTNQALGNGFGITLNNGGFSNRVFIGKNSANSSVVAIISVSGNVVNISGGSYSDTEFKKIAISYKSGETKLFLNGSQIGSTSLTTYTLPSLISLNFDGGGVASFYGECKDLRVYKTSLTDFELLGLTSPFLYPSFNEMATELNFNLI